jgi:drug/metabolite transporter (DMT)-like permease
MLRAGQILQLIAIALLGLGYTLQSGFYFSAVRFIPMSLASPDPLLLPGVCLPAGLPGRRGEATGRTLAALAAALAGVVLVLGTAYGRANLQGVLLALGASLGAGIGVAFGAAFTDRGKTKQNSLK